jgi:hypothetical protein
LTTNFNKNGDPYAPLRLKRESQPSAVSQTAGFVFQAYFAEISDIAQPVDHFVGCDLVENGQQAAQDLMRGMANSNDDTVVRLFLRNVMLRHCLEIGPMCVSRAACWLTA